MLLPLWELFHWGSCPQYCDLVHFDLMGPDEHCLRLTGQHFVLQPHLFLVLSSNEPCPLLPDLLLPTQISTCMSSSSYTPFEHSVLPTQLMSPSLEFICIVSCIMKLHVPQKHTRRPSWGGDWVLYPQHLTPSPTCRDAKYLFSE